MATDKKTISFTTPVQKHKVVIKGFLTGFDQETIDWQHEVVDDEQITGVQRATRKTIELAVVSIDGEEKDVVDKWLAMDLRDYQEVIAQINKITEPLSKKK